MSKRRYCYRGLPKCIKAGRYLVHNHVYPIPVLGGNGFRAWTQEGRSGLVRCLCDFGGCENADLHDHYRMKDGVPRGWTTANSAHPTRWLPKGWSVKRAAAERESWREG
jgi:hypothetical protein